MCLLVASILLIIFIILFKRSYNQYASGLRERPSYFLWFFTQVLKFKGWSAESYCLQTNGFQSTDRPGYLSEEDIPKRTQSRPKMLRALPHRQLTQQAPDEIMNEMHKYMHSISIPRCGGETLNNDLLLYGPSVVEYTGADGIFLPNPKHNEFGKGEIAHLHSNDGSFHMILHPSDAKLLINQQWAERFPLAGLNLFNRISVPETFVLVYAPQNENELKLWKIILNAAISYNRDQRKKL